MLTRSACNPQAYNSHFNHHDHHHCHLHHHDHHPDIFPVRYKSCIVVFSDEVIWNLGQTGESSATNDDGGGNNSKPDICHFEALKIVRKKMGKFGTKTGLQQNNIN